MPFAMDQNWRLIERLFINEVKSSVTPTELLEHLPSIRSRSEKDRIYRMERHDGPLIAWSHAMRVLESSDTISEEMIVALRNLNQNAIADRMQIAIYEGQAPPVACAPPVASGGADASANMVQSIQPNGAHSETSYSMDEEDESSTQYSINEVSVKSGNTGSRVSAPIQEVGQSVQESSEQNQEGREAETETARLKLQEIPQSVNPWLQPSDEISMLSSNSEDMSSANYSLDSHVSTNTCVTHSDELSPSIQPGGQSLSLVQSPTQSPMQTPTQSPVQPPTQSPVQPPTQFPVQPPTQSPVQPPTQSPVQTPTQSLVQPPTQSPVQPPTQSPMQTPTQSPVQPPTQSPVQPPTQSPVQTPTQSPMQTPTQSQVQPPTQSLVQTPTQSPMQTPTQSPIQTPTQSPMQTPTQSLVQPPTQSLVQTLTQSQVQPPTQSLAKPAVSSGHIQSLILFSGVIICVALVAYRFKK